MFEFLFKYPPVVFSKGKLVLLSPWPLWLMGLLLIAAAAGIFWHIRQRHLLVSRARTATLWIAQTAMVALLLFLLWHPAISVARLRPQQNVVAVLVDHSKSMGMAENGKPTRLQDAEGVLNAKLLAGLNERFQVRLYGLGKDATRIENLNGLKADENSTRIGDSLKHIVAEAGSMPLGAIVLLSDGGDNSGGIDRETISQLRQIRVPVHTIGFGPESFAKDIEIVEASLPARALPNSRVSARVAIRQHGYSNQKVKLVARENGKPLAIQEVTLRADNAEQSEAMLFDVGEAGAHSIQIGIDPAAGEENVKNNAVIRLVNVSNRKPRILYVEGEPRWEYKFLRRAVEDDRNIDLVSMVRTTQNKIYRQGVSNPKELEDGFPTKAEDLFAYDGLIIGSVEAGYFTNTQQDLIKEFANRRGGGVLFLAGRASLSDGGYAHSPIAEMLPLRIGAEKSWVREQATVELTPAGREDAITRIEEDRDKNLARWKNMPKVANYQIMASPKAGAVVLMTVAQAGHKPSPLLTIQKYGHGRVAVFATAGSWRWRMWQDHTDKSHSVFWEQLLRWLVTETPGTVASSTKAQVLADDGHLPLRVEVRDKQYQAVVGATVEATVVRPDGGADVVSLTPDPIEAGVYASEYTAEKPGSYVMEIAAKQAGADLGRDTLTFRREDGIAENFGAAQNKELLRKLSEDTGGKYYSPSDAGRLSKEVAVSDAGINAHENLDIWDMPIIFLIAIGLRGSEWLARRKWGVV